MGMRRFSIQKPRVSGRSHLDIMFSNFIRDYGIIGSNLFFVRHSRNGKDLDLMMVEELPTKYLLERQGRRNGPIFEWDEDSYYSAVDANPKNDRLISHFEQTNFIVLFENSLLKQNKMAELIWFGRGLMRAFVLNRVDRSCLAGDEKANEPAYGC